MVPFASRSVRIIAEEDETAGGCRSSLPVERWREIPPSQVNRLGISDPLGKADELTIITMMKFGSIPG
jgi:hypothetical protein